MNIFSLFRKQPAKEDGHQRLWGFFGLTHTSWLVLPRVLMHEMPADWQGRMTDLLEEMSAAFPNAPGIETQITMKKHNRFIPMPSWLNYRHVERNVVDSFKRSS